MHIHGCLDRGPLAEPQTWGRSRSSCHRPSPAPPPRGARRDTCPTVGSIRGLTARWQRCVAKWVPDVTALPRNGIYQTHGWCLVAPREDPLAPLRIFFPLPSPTAVPPPRPSWGPSLPAILDPSSQEALWACCHQWHHFRRLCRKGFDASKSGEPCSE